MPAFNLFLQAFPRLPVNILHYLHHFALYIGGAAYEAWPSSRQGFGELVVFVGVFPLLLSVFWSSSALYSVVRSYFPRRKRPREMSELPSFSILIPFFGDTQHLDQTVASLQCVSPAPEQIVLIDDGSPSGGGADDLLTNPKVRLIRLEHNVGKAEALNRALRTVHSDIVVCLDSDTIAATTDWSSMLHQFADDSGLGAVTGKIWPTAIRNGAQLIQAIDYLAVICLVKSAEALWGGLTTVSGAWVAYRREALEDCGGWNVKTSAEDIDVSWRLQSRGWRIWYDPAWTARIEMAPSWASLWRQRRRWSSGLGRTMREQLFDALGAKARHLPMAFIAVMSIIWVGFVLTVMGVGAAALLMHHGFIFLGMFPAADWNSHWSQCTEAFLVQFLAAMTADDGGWRRYPLLLLCAAFYPLYFWIILFSSFVVGFPQGFCQLDSGRWRATAGQRDEALA